MIKVFPKGVSGGVPLMYLVGLRSKTSLGISIILGLLASALIIGLDFLFSNFTESLTVTQTTPPIWQGFLTSFYGGVGEEIAMRLFLMTLLVWIFYKIKRTKEGKPTNLSVWLAIIIAAILFGLGHLPFVAALTSITPLKIFQLIILNGAAGIIFGWLYWKRGLDSAMLSHFSADIVLHVALPLFA